MVQITLEVLSLLCNIVKYVVKWTNIINMRHAHLAEVEDILNHINNNTINKSHEKDYFIPDNLIRSTDFYKQ